MLKEIEGYNGKYLADSDGHIVSVNYRCRKNSGVSKVLKTQKSIDGYESVCLYYDGKKKRKKVHRLIAETFLENDDPQNKTQVDHIIPISEGGTNKLSNLRWCTPKQNANNQHTRKNLGKSIIQADLCGKIIKEWDTAKEAADELKLNISSLRWCASYSKNKTYNGYIWEWMKN